MSVAELPIAIDREKIAAFCRARGIRKLSLFGSVLRPDYDPERSDVGAPPKGSTSHTPDYAKTYRQHGKRRKRFLQRVVNLDVHAERTQHQDADESGRGKD